MDLTEEGLAKLLKEASEAHHDYEKALGKPDADWPDWYARFIIEKLALRQYIKEGGR